MRQHGLANRQRDAATIAEPALTVRHVASRRACAAPHHRVRRQASAIIQCGSVKAKDNRDPRPACRDFIPAAADIDPEQSRRHSIEAAFCTSM